MRRTMLATPVVALLSGALLAGCAPGAGSPGAGSSGASTAGFAEVLAMPAPTADYAWYPETVTDALPSVRYPGDAHASELAAVGRFTGWEPGEPPHPSLEMIDLTFEVDEVIDSVGDLTMLEGTTVAVHVGIDGSAGLERVAEELLALDDVVLFLNHVGPEPWPPPEWVIVFDNAFLGDVDDGGAITWPVAEAIAANNPADSHPEADVTTLDGLRAAATAATTAATTEERTVDVSLD